MVSIRKFRIIVLVSNRIEYWSNYSIRNVEYSHSTTYQLVKIDVCCFSWLWLQVGCICVLVRDVGAVSDVVSTAARVDRRLPSQSDQHQSEELRRHRAGGQRTTPVLLDLPRGQRARRHAPAPSWRPHPTSSDGLHGAPQPAPQTNWRQVSRTWGIGLLGRRF